jgi:hypothetical protein
LEAKLSYKCIKNFYRIRKTNNISPNVRLQAKVQLAAKNHAPRLDFLAMPPKQCCIMKQLAAASLVLLKRLPLGKKVLINIGGVYVRK